MTTEGFRRKPSAILSADVEGYSRLMGEDEEATVRTLTAHKLLGVCSVPDPFRIFEEKRQRYSAPPFGL